MNLKPDTKFWVVLNATEESTVNDVAFQTTIAGLERQFKGGLTADRIVLMTASRETATNEARHQIELAKVKATVDFCEVCEEYKAYVKGGVCRDCEREHTEELQSQGNDDDEVEHVERIKAELEPAERQTVREAKRTGIYIEFSDPLTAHEAQYKIQQVSDRDGSFLYFDSKTDRSDAARHLRNAEGMTIPDEALS